MLAAVLVVFTLGGTRPASENQDINEPGLLAHVIAVTAAVALVMWRWRPMWTFIVTGTAVVAYVALGNAFGPILISGVFAVYGFTSRVGTKRAIQATSVLVAATIGAVSVRIATDAGDWGEYGTTVAWVVIPAAVGIAVHIRRTSAAEVRAAEARSAVSEERLRMAQEIHDTVGHGLAVIAMQAGVALHVLDREPEQVRESLEAIRAASRDSLDDLRAELDVLRGVEARYRPGAGVAELPALVERIRSSGLPVRLSLNADGLPPDVDLAAYRIVQESLTNVLKHAGPDATAKVSVARVTDALTIEVRDDGKGGATPDRIGGHGIIGMQGRAEAVGGTLSAGPHPAGGFMVSARLPVPSTSSELNDRSEPR